MKPLLLPLAFACITALPAVAQSTSTAMSNPGGGHFGNPGLIDRIEQGGYPPTPLPEGAVITLGRDCSSSSVEGLVGQHLSATSSLGSTHVRVFSAESMAGTTDYLPWRFNVFVDADGMITQAFCG
jgi:hypothetical protein